MQVHRELPRPAADIGDPPTGRQFGEDGQQTPLDRLRLQIIQDEGRIVLGCSVVRGPHDIPGVDATQ